MVVCVPTRSRIRGRDDLVDPRVDREERRPCRRARLGRVRVRGMVAPDLERGPAATRDEEKCDAQQGAWSLLHESATIAAMVGRHRTVVMAHLEGLLALALAGCSGGDGKTDTGPADADGDGFTGEEEAACGSDPDDVASTCYACGWQRHDPGDLVSSGAAPGDTIANMTLVDRCGEEVPLWDFAGEYHVLFLTAAW